MRATRLSFVLLLTQCTPATTLHVGKLGDKSATVAGDTVTFRRIDIQGNWHPKQGVHFVHTAAEWAEAFRPERKMIELDVKLGKPQEPTPPLPDDVDLTKETLVVATGVDEQGAGFELDAATKDKRGLHLHWMETLHGEGCVQNPPGTPPPMDIAAIQGKDWKSADIWIDRQTKPACTAKPKAQIYCTLDGAALGEQKTDARPGQHVECDGTKSDQGAVGPIVDRTWYLREVPDGSTTLLKVIEDSKKANFLIDAFGTYTLMYTVRDDQGRGNTMSMSVDAPAPSDMMVVQMGWARFDRAEKKENFPKVELHGNAAGFRPGSAPLGADCSATAEKVPDWCQTASYGLVTIAKIKSKQKFPVTFGVKYLEDRGPGAQICLRVFNHGGTTPVETCDLQSRSAGDVWSPGNLDWTTGAFKK